MASLAINDFSFSCLLLFFTAAYLSNIFYHCHRLSCVPHPSQNLALSRSLCRSLYIARTPSLSLNAQLTPRGWRRHLRFSAFSCFFVLFAVRCRIAHPLPIWPTARPLFIVYFGPAWFLPSQSVCKCVCTHMSWLNNAAIIMAAKNFTQTLLFADLFASCTSSYVPRCPNAVGESIHILVGQMWALHMWLLALHSNCATGRMIDEKGLTRNLRARTLLWLVPNITNQMQTQELKACAKGSIDWKPFQI